MTMKATAAVASTVGTKNVSQYSTTWARVMRATSSPHPRRYAPRPTQGGLAMDLDSPGGCLAAEEAWLADMARRLAHVRGVAALAEDLAARARLDGEAAGVLVRTAWLQDVGHAKGLARTGLHPLDGAEWVRARGGGAAACLVAHHSLARLQAAEHGLDLAGYPREEGVVADRMRHA